MGEIEGLASRTREELAVLVPEYLLGGHLIDRAAMPYLITRLGADGMRDVAIEEWRGASPVYSKRMQVALGFEDDSVETIFKNIQIDIGAPPQFLDFRFAVRDRDHGEFWLDHCGALMDVEPMGPDYVRAMCHDIEDPTFDATATATNARARVRPIHRPPRTPADRTPHCHWTVTIDPAAEELPVPAEAEVVAGTRAAAVALAAIDPSEPGRHEYGGPLESDLRFADWSRSALVRIAEEACLQGQLLSLSGAAAARRRMTADETDDLIRRQLAGVGGVVAGRLRDALGLGRGVDDLATVLRLHPAFLPEAYVGLTVDRVTDPDGGLVLRFPARSGAVEDRAWAGLVDADHLRPLDAIVRGVDPRFRCEVRGSDDDGLVVGVVEGVDGEVPDREAEEVVLTRFSTGADFRFRERGTPVVIGRR